MQSKPTPQYNNTHKKFPGLYEDPVNGTIWFFIQEDFGVIVFNKHRPDCIGETIKGEDAKYCSGSCHYYRGSLTISND